MTGHEKLHQWFALSYASYLTVPRSILQSMPDEWQGRMADLLNELNDELCRQDIRWPGQGFEPVVLIRHRETGVQVPDQFNEYQRGRLRLW